jgi:hypothetical protein
MVKPVKGIALCLLVASIAWPSTVVRAEVSADTEQAVNLLILMGITEGPDPIPQRIWNKLRDVDDSLLLNADGGIKRADGRPDAAFHPETSSPHVVWAYDLETDHDIAYSFWNGDGWDETEFLSPSTEDELDPRIFISSGGTIYVVWWVAGDEQIWMSSRATAFSTWEVPESVTGLIDAGRRPSIIVSGGSVRTAYERDASPGGQEVVVATRIDEGVYDMDVIAVTQSTKALNVILHDEQGVRWIDWRHSDDEFAFSVYEDGSWGPLNTFPWIDDSWARAEEVRRVIRGIVLSASQ